MPAKYSQLKAMLAITKGSLKAILRSPSAVVFSIAFPLIFILVFGFIGGGNGKTSVKIAIDQGSDTSSPIYTALSQINSIKIVKGEDAFLLQELEKGRITAKLFISKTGLSSPAYAIKITSSGAVMPQNIQLLQSVLNGVIAGMNQKYFPTNQTIARVDATISQIPGRAYKTIDFILPGQLGFSLLSSGVFGVAFLFFNLRQQLVLKRFYATPIKRAYIVLGEALSRVLFQLLTAIIVIGVGHFAFGFTLVHGFTTFLTIMLLSFIALVLFMGFGFIVSGLAKNESTIPPFANLFTLPQFLLAGTFFAVEAFPTWLQPICNALPLTHFNNAMRNIAFEGASLASCSKELLILGLWIVGVYGVAFKTFKWD
jgi:ABC-2 type transport system permease protein